MQAGNRARWERVGVRYGVATGRAQPEPKHRFGRWRRPATGCGAGCRTICALEFHDNASAWRARCRTAYLLSVPDQSNQLENCSPMQAGSEGSRVGGRAVSSRRAPQAGLRAASSSFGRNGDQGHDFAALPLPGVVLDRDHAHHPEQHHAPLLPHQVPRHQVDVDICTHFAVLPGGLQLRFQERKAAGEQHLHQRIVRPHMEQYARHRIGVPRR